VKREHSVCIMSASRLLMDEPSWFQSKDLKWRSMRSALGSMPVNSRNACTAWKTAIPPPSSAAATLPSSVQKSGLQREVDDIGDPHVRVEQFGLQWQAGEFGHANRRAVDHAIRRRHCASQVLACDGAARSEARSNVGGKMRCPPRIRIEDG